MVIHDKLLALVSSAHGIHLPPLRIAICGLAMLQLLSSSLIGDPDQFFDRLLVKA